MTRSQSHGSVPTRGSAYPGHILVISRIYLLRSFCTETPEEKEPGTIDYWPTEVDSGLALRVGLKRERLSINPPSFIPILTPMTWSRYPSIPQLCFYMQYYTTLTFSLLSSPARELSSVHTIGQKVLVTHAIAFAHHHRCFSSCPTAAPH